MTMLRNIATCAASMFISILSYGKGMVPVADLPEGSAVVLRYTKVITSQRDPESIRERASFLRQKVDHPEFAEWYRHFRLIEAPERSDSRLVYGDRRCVYHLTNMSNGISWERGATSKRRWSFFDQSRGGEPAGELVVIEVDKPVPVHRDVSKMLEDSERAASLFLRFGLPLSAVVVPDAAAGKAAIYVSKPLDQRFKVEGEDSGSLPVSVVEVSLESAPGMVLERILFSEDVVQVGTRVVLPRSIEVISVQQATRTIYTLEHAELIGRTQADALADVPPEGQFGPASAVRRIDFSERSTIRDPEYAGVPTVTWSIRRGGKDEFSFEGLPIAAGAGAENPVPGDAGGREEAGTGFVVSRTAVAAVAVAVGLLVFGVFYVSKKGKIQ